MGDLAERYHYGLSLDWKGTSHPEAGGKERISLYRRRNDLLDAQIRSQRSAIAELEYSNFAAENSIIASIEDGVQHLEQAISTSAGQICDAIAEGTAEIVSALSTISWQIEQTNDRLGQIIELLKENRSNEARQFVNQGVRHFSFGEFAEAEERFRKAMEYDSTDYQVLMNLAYVSIEKGSYEEAKLFFEKAANLPSNLDQESLNAALSGLARLEYSVGNYREALTILQNVKPMNNASRASTEYRRAVYSFLAGEFDQFPAHLENAIRYEKTYFGTSAAEADFKQRRDYVTGILVDLHTRTFTVLQEQLNGLQQELDESCPQNTHTRTARDSLLELTNSMKGGLSPSMSYSALMNLLQKAKRAKQLITILMNEEKIYLQRRSYSSQATVSRESRFSAGWAYLCGVIAASPLLLLGSGILTVVAILLWPLYPIAILGGGHLPTVIGMTVFAYVCGIGGGFGVPALKNNARNQKHRAKLRYEVEDEFQCRIRELEREIHQLRDSLGE